jgi:hypothetical protein
MPGGWSNIMKVKTKSKGSLSVTTYYKNLSTGVSQILKSVISKVTQPQSTTIVLQTPTLNADTVTQPTTSQPVVQTSKKKFCILWWCF